MPQLEQNPNNANTVPIPDFGSVYFAELPGDEHVQAGCRPVLIAQNDIGNKFSPTVEIIPMSTQTRKASYMPTHVVIRATRENGLRRDSVVLAEQCATIPKARLIARVGRLNHHELVRVGRARRVQSPFPED